MTSDAKDPEGNDARIAAKLKLVQAIADLKNEATTSNVEHTKGGRTLRDEDILVVPLSLRVSRSQLEHAGGATSRVRAAGPDPVQFDSDPTDIASCDHDPPIVLPE